MIHTGLNTMGIPYIVNDNFIRNLPQTSDTANSLLKSGWSPRDIYVNQDSCSLKVQAFRCSIRTEYDFNFS